MVKRCASFLLIVVMGLMGLCGCVGAPPPDYLAYQKEDFCAEVEGDLEGQAFGAKIAVESSGDARRVTVEYLSPDMLEGAAITAICTADGTPTGEAEIRYDNMSLTRDAQALSGLLSPATCLLKLAELSAVQKDGDLYVLTFPDGITLTLDANGDPRSFASEALSFNIVWREQKR